MNDKKGRKNSLIRGKIYRSLESRLWKAEKELADEFNRRKMLRRSLKTLDGEL